MTASWFEAVLTNKQRTLIQQICLIMIKNKNRQYICTSKTAAQWWVLVEKGTTHKSKDTEFYQYYYYFKDFDNVDCASKKTF